MPPRSTPERDPERLDVLYARVSTDRQERDETIETQIGEIESYCSAAGIHIAERFLDDGITGRLPFAERLEAGRLLQLAAVGRINSVITYKTNRMGRDALDILSTLSTLRKLGVKVVYAKERFEDSPVGRFAQGMFSLVAELDWENIRENTMAGLRRAAAQGKWVSGPIPYGYRKNADGFLIPDDTPLPVAELTPARVIYLVFRWVADERLSTWDVAERLNSWGVPTQEIAPNRVRAVLWRHTRIARIIRASVYRGRHLYRAHGGSLDREVCALVEPELWERANEHLAANRKLTKGERNRYLLSGLIRCASCGARYSGRTSIDPQYGRWAYYLCWRRNGRPEEGGRCTNPNVRSDKLEAEVWGDVEARLRNPKRVLKQMREEMREDRGNVSSLERDRKRLHGLQAAKAHETQEVLTWYRRGRIDHRAADAQLEQIQRETAEIESQIVAIDARIKACEDEEARLESTEQILTRLRAELDGELTWERKRAVIEETVSKVVIRPDGRAHVAYKFQER